MNRVFMILVFTMTTAAGITLWSGTLVAANPGHGKPGNIPPVEAMDRLKAGNEHFVAGIIDPHEIGEVRRIELTAGQHPFAVVLACADSRVPPELLFNQGLGDLFVIRVAGNVVDPVILGSMEYAVEHIGIRLVVVLGHDSCGGVQAVIDTRHNAEHNDGKHEHDADESTDADETVPANLSLLARKIHIGDELPDDPHDASVIAVRRNLQHQIEAMMRNSDYLEAKTESEFLRVVPAIYHLETGKVEWFHELSPNDAKELHELGHDPVAD